MRHQNCLFIGIGSSDRTVRLKANQNQPLAGGIAHINEETGRASIKGAVSRESVPPPHTPYSSKMGEIFLEKTA